MNLFLMNDARNDAERSARKSFYLEGNALKRQKLFALQLKNLNCFYVSIPTLAIDPVLRQKYGSAYIGKQNVLIRFVIN